VDQKGRSDSLRAKVAT